MVVQNISADINTSFTLSRCRQPKVHFINLYRCRQIYLGILDIRVTLWFGSDSLSLVNHSMRLFKLEVWSLSEKLLKIVSSGLSEE